jgi:type I restriction enzyme M protein
LNWSISLATQDIVQKLWSLCDILRDDGVTYHQYVTELTYILFLKMAKETETEKELPKSYRWDDLYSRVGIDKLTFYKNLLNRLGSPDSGSSARVRSIFVNANTFIRQPKHLEEIVKQIENIDWFTARADGLGDLYEGLLEKNASEKKSGAGQYFTPRPLISSIVAVMQPKPGEIIQDPAAGTGGFLIAAHEHIKAETDDLFKLPEKEQKWQRTKAYQGMELVDDTHRLALMNLMLHGIESEILRGSTLSPTGKELSKADLILSNPPFGTAKGGGLLEKQQNGKLISSRDDFTYPTNNKQLAFLQHIYRGLKPGGRAAVVLPDNVLFEGNTGSDIRRDLMNKCNLHTILRLPTGIFYAQGVKTNVLFFTRGDSDKDNTKEVWIYDLRANAPQFGKRTPLKREYFKEFEEAFGKDPVGSKKALSKRKEEGETGRFRKFSRDWIAERGDSLDISWLKDDSDDNFEDMPEPEAIAQLAINELEGAIEGLREIIRELGTEIQE